MTQQQQQQQQYTASQQHAFSYQARQSAAQLQWTEAALKPRLQRSRFSIARHRQQLHRQHCQEGLACQLRVCLGLLSCCISSMWSACLPRVPQVVGSQPTRNTGPPPPHLCPPVCLLLDVAQDHVLNRRRQARHLPGDVGLMRGAMKGVVRKHSQRM